ncbi:MAG: LptE family protein [Bacteroidia bacterium]|nr:LptE family protein [Bacteroidia bacterium]
MKNVSYLVLFAACLILAACRVSFNTTGVPKIGGTSGVVLETLYVDQFINEAPIVVPYLAPEMTLQLQDRFLSQSKLSLTDPPADVELGGSITRYDVAPIAITGTTSAEQNRLSISVRVSFKNNKDENASWEQTFSGFVDFDASEDFTSVEEEKINEILEQITQDIFTKSLGKW